MAVAFDAQTKSTAFTHGTLGTITYGGVTLNLVTEAHDNTTEILGAYVYFRGSGIPSGAQTVEIKDSGGSTLTSFTHTPVGTPSGVLVFVGDAVDALLSIAWAVTVTANNTTSIEASGIFEDNALDPSLVLSTGASQETYVISMFVSGIGTPSGIDSGTGFTSFSNHDLGNQSAEIADIDTNATGGNVTVPWITTPTTDDVAIVAVAVKENSFPSVQALAPSADSVDGNWTDQAGGTTLYAAIDETIASDSDYIKSELLSSGSSACRVKLQAGLDPFSSINHNIKWRVAKNASSGATIDMTVKLYQGGGNSIGGGTLIATFTRNNVSTTVTEYTETLSSGEANSITDYTDLYLEFSAAAS